LPPRTPLGSPAPRTVGVGSGRKRRKFWATRAPIEGSALAARTDAPEPSSSDRVHGAMSLAPHGLPVIGLCPQRRRANYGAEVHGGDDLARTLGDRKPRSAPRASTAAEERRARAPGSRTARGAAPRPCPLKWLATEEVCRATSLVSASFSYARSPKANASSCPRHNQCLCRALSANQLHWRTSR
jgi:hypothetical protein